MTWLFGACVSVCISFVYHYLDYEWDKKLFYTFIYPTLEFAFILLAIVTYVVIFKKYDGSERVLSQRRKSVRENRKPDSSFTVFRKSRFFVPFLLILSFIIFMVIPDLIVLFVGVLSGGSAPLSDVLISSCWISYAVANIVDALIYIFMQDSVRRLLWKKGKRVLGIPFNESFRGFELVERQRSRFMSDTTNDSRLTSDSSSSCRSRIHSATSYNSRQFTYEKSVPSRQRSSDTTKCLRFAPDTEKNTDNENREPKPNTILKPTLKVGSCVSPTCKARMNYEYYDPEFISEKIFN